MNHDAVPMELELQYRSLFSVTDAAGVRIECRAGAVWITLDNDSRDIVLEAGESFCTPEHRRALIYAMEASRLRMGAPSLSASPAERLLDPRAMQAGFA